MPASIGKIYSYPNNPRVAKAAIAAKYNNQEITIIPDFKMGETNKTPEFLAKFPLGRVPAFESADSSFTLYESNAIAYYAACNVEKTQLLGTDKKQAAKIQQWVSFADNELTPISHAWIYPILGYAPLDVAATKKAQIDIKKPMTALEKNLLDQTFLVGECITLADISLVCTLIPFMKLVFDPEFRSSYKSVTRWFLTCVNQEKFKAVLGNVELCKVMSKAEPAKKAEKPAKGPKAAAAKPAATEEPEEESFADEKPKEKNPLDLLPKSSLNLDEWKRFYSNNETKDSCAWFWKNFDPTGYSIYKCEYRYPEELKQIFMSSNLVGGFFQRLERAKKYAFGSVCVLGEDNKNVISGVFVFRGAGIPFEVTDAADYESYKFKKMELNDATKKIVDEYFSWGESNGDVVEGKKFADGKIFK